MFPFWNHITAPLLEILSPREILQIGSGTGRTAQKLCEYAHTAAAKLTIIDPFPLFDLAALQRTWGDVITMHRTWSIDALPLCTPPDVVIIDGDHNWFTVFHELQSMENLAKKSGRFPVVLLHDVGWPYARRDAYVLPGMIPEKFRHPFSEGGVIPETERLVPHGGLNERMFHAIRSGGPRNGVLTGLEDFLAQTSHVLSVTMIEGFHGLAIITPEKNIDSHPALATLLSSFSLAPTAKKHLALLEGERIQNVLSAKDLRFALDAHRVERDSYRQAMDTLSAEKYAKDMDIQRRERTLSWRMTAPLRHIGSSLRMMGEKRSWCGTLKNVWAIFGEPFPGFVRFVRHQLLGSMFPVAPSLASLQQHDAVLIQDHHGGAAPVSVIVTARNNGEFLRECLESIRAQTVKPMEIIYCDDGSSDQSVAIASSFPDVRVLPLSHRGVAEARNAAVAESTGDLLLHIDGDDSIPPEYLAEQLKALNSSSAAAFAYGISGVGHLHSGSLFLPWDIKRLWTRNFINTSSLVRRSAFLAAGGWRDGASTLWDWDLWLRMSRIGPGVPSNAILHYRRHDRSWSQLERQLSSDDIGRLFGRIRRAVAKVSVCAIVSGRLPELTDTWVDALATSIRASTSAVHPPELIILDNSRCDMASKIRQALERYPDLFRSVMIIPYDVRFSWTCEVERQHAVSRFLATAYNRLLSMADGEIVWFVEDDIVVPTCAYETLLRDLTDGEVPPAAVSGLYRARHRDQLVAHRVENGVPVLVQDSHTAPLDIDLAGTGCLMAFRPFITHPFTSHWRGRAPAHDWAWCDAIRHDEHRIILDPRVRCRHYQTLTEYV